MMTKINDYITQITTEGAEISYQERVEEKKFKI